MTAIFDHLWRDGAAGTDTEELAGVARTLGIVDVDAAITAPVVKVRLRANTDTAIATGVFRGPTLRIDHELFWGNDASAMIDAFLDDAQRFRLAEYRRAAQLSSAITRNR